MTDRAQPGAIDSVIRNDELAQVLGQLTGGFDDGWVVDPADPTAASRRRTGINESAFDGFALSGVSSSSLSLDVGPGEAFAGGWLAMDASKSVNLPANTTSIIVALMDLNAIYDPQNDPDRDAADKVVIDIAANVSDDLPRVQLHELTTDSSGVASTTDLRKPYGPSLEADSATVGALEANSLTIGGTLYEEDANSPIDVSGTTSTSYTVDGDYDKVAVVPDRSAIGFDQLQVNGDTGSNYNYVDQSGTETTGATEFSIPNASDTIAYWVWDSRGVGVRLSINGGQGLAGDTQSGRNNGIVGGSDINSLTFSDSGSTNRDFKARVYGRVMNV